MRALRAARRRASWRRPAAARVRAGAAVLAVNAATRGVRPAARAGSRSPPRTSSSPSRCRTCSRSSAGPAASASPTRARFVHYFRTTPDGRIAFGWGGGRLALGRPARRPRRGRPRGGRRDAPSTSSRMFPALEGARDHPRLGRPDRRLARATCRRSARSTARPSHYAFGFTGNGVGPSPPGRPRCSPRWPPDEPTPLALVDPTPALRPAGAARLARAECWCAVPFCVRSASRRRAARSIR